MRLWIAAVVLMVSACDLGGDEPPLVRGPKREGPELYQAYCVSCHDGQAGSRAPALMAMRRMSVSTIAFAMTNGRMKAQATELSLQEKIRLATYIGAPDEAYAPSADSRCVGGSIDPTPRVPRWGVDERNTARIGADVTRVDSTNVARLEFAWAFGLPRSGNARSLPVITEDTLFVAAEGAGIFALDRRSGCTKWHRPTEAPPRTALALGRAGDRAALFFGDIEAHVNAVDALSGELIWRRETRVGEHTTLTGAPVPWDDALVVPLSSAEVPLAADDAHECCRTHGAVMRLDASAGEIRWTTHLTEEAVRTGENRRGVPSWGPSGVAVWSTPTIDRKRGRIYVGTAQNASAPATRYSDSVLALSFETGVVDWHYQALAGDAYNGACDRFPRGANCPRRPGPDHDIGASVILTRDGTGREILLAGQKSGDVYALDPDDGGKRIWHERVGAGSPLGGIHWGMAVGGGLVFAPVADPEFPIPGYFPAPGLYALTVDTGEVKWKVTAKRGCETDLETYFDREGLYPGCSYYYGFSAAPTVVGDVVFAPSLDGRARAFATSDGRALWEFETARAFESVNGVETHGGSIDVAGVTAVGDMVYVQSGYGVFGQLPGNALLAFRLKVEEAQADAAP